MLREAQFSRHRR